MLAKSWKKICLVILIIACLFNIISKIVYKVSFEKVVNNYLDKYTQQNTNKKA